MCLSFYARSFFLYCSDPLACFVYHVTYSYNLLMGSILQQHPILYLLCDYGLYNMASYSYIVLL